MQYSDFSIELYCPKPRAVTLIEDIRGGWEKIQRNPSIEPCCIIYSSSVCMGFYSCCITWNKALWTANSVFIACMNLNQFGCILFLPIVS